MRALIKTKPGRTLDFLLTRSKETTVEILSTYLSNVYVKAMAEGISPQSFIDALKEFDKVKNKHVGLIWELEEELGDMTYHIRERASTLNLPTPVESVDMIRPSHMLEMVPAVVDAIRRRGYRSFSELSTDLKVPERLVQVMSEVTTMPIHGVPLIETTQSKLKSDIDKLPPTANIKYPAIWKKQAPWIV